MDYDWIQAQWVVKPLSSPTLSIGEMEEEHRAKIEAEIIRLLQVPMKDDDPRAVTRATQLVDLFRKLGSYWYGTYEERILSRRSGDQLVDLLFLKLSRPTRARIFKVLNMAPGLWK